MAYVKKLNPEKRGRKRGQGSKYIHLLRVMKPGDVLYLPEHTGRLDKAIYAAVHRRRGKAETACFVATTLDPDFAHRIVRVTMIEPLKD